MLYADYRGGALGLGRRSLPSCSAEPSHLRDVQRGARLSLQGLLVPAWRIHCQNAGPTLVQRMSDASPTWPYPRLHLWTKVLP